MNKIISLDYLLTNFLNRLTPHNTFFDYFFSFFSLKGSFIFVWLLVMLIVLILEERKNSGITKHDKKFIILLSVAFLSTFSLSDIILKNIFLRPRPFLSSSIYHLGSLSCPKDFSFPSAHAATAFAAATIFTYFDKKRKGLYYTIAVLISYSRIYLGCHYFLDVISGAIIGYIISQLLLFVHGTFPFHRRS